MSDLPSIAELDLPPAHKRWKAQRCCRLTQSTGTHYFDGNKQRCARIARFKFNDMYFCAQHAGEASLEYLYNKQEGAA